MNLLYAGLVIVAVAAVTITAMLLVRRRAPEGSYFEDGDRAAGVFGVISTGFAVMLGFVVFLAFQSYDTSRSGAEAEAHIVAQQFETAQFMPAAARSRSSQASSSVTPERGAPGVAADGSNGLGSVFNPWGVAMFKTIKTVQPVASLRSRRRTASGSTSDPTARRPAPTARMELRA